METILLEVLIHEFNQKLSSTTVIKTYYGLVLHR